MAEGDKTGAVSQYIQETKAELRKVVWPTRREVLLTTIMVFIMAMLTALFFFFVDSTASRCMAS